MKMNQRTWNTTELSMNTIMPTQLMVAMNLSCQMYTYRGVPLIKNPLDFALYHLLLWNLKPRTILEIGSFSGGSAAWMGDLLNTYGIDGHVYSVDLNPVTWIQHPRVTFLAGNAQQLEATFHDAGLRSLPRPWLVIDDADHSYASTAAIMKFFHPYLDAGDYLLVEDGLSHGGVVKAIQEFWVQHQSEYEIDSDYCDFYGYNMTCLVNGFLKKLTPAACLQSQSVPGQQTFVL